MKRESLIIIFLFSLIIVTSFVSGSQETLYSESNSAIYPITNLNQEINLIVNHSTEKIQAIKDTAFYTTKPLPQKNEATKSIKEILSINEIEKTEKIKITPSFFSADTALNKKINSSIKISNLNKNPLIIENIIFDEKIKVQLNSYLIESQDSTNLTFEINPQDFDLRVIETSIQIITNKGNASFPIKLNIKEKTNNPEILNNNIPETQKINKTFPDQNNNQETANPKGEDDSCNGANPFPPNQTWYAYIDSAGDIDWWIFYAQYNSYGMRVTLDVPAGKDYDLKVYGGCDVFGNGTNHIKTCQAGGSEDCRIDVQAGNWYYIKVYGYSDYDYDPNNPYYIRVEYPCSSNQCYSEYWNQCINNGSLCCSGDPIFGQHYCNTDNWWIKCTNSEHNSCQYLGGYHCTTDGSNWAWRTCEYGCSNGTCIEPTCNVYADSAWTTQSSYACDEDIKTKHKFVNNGDITVDYDIYYYLYKPNGELFHSGSDFGSLTSGYETTWTWTSYAPIGGWPETGTYHAKTKMIAHCPSADDTEYNHAYPFVPNAPCPTCNATPVQAWPSKSSYDCGENLIAYHKYSNTGELDFTYDIEFYLYDPDGQLIQFDSVTNNILLAGYYTIWDSSYSPPAGGWEKPGNYTSKTKFIAHCSGGDDIEFLETQLYVPNAPCANCSLSSENGTPLKPLFKAYENIVTQNHKFTNTGNQTFNYTFYSELYDPNNNLLSSSSKPNQTLTSGYFIDWNITITPPNVWIKTGTYTMKTWVSGTCTNGENKTLYSYAYPVIEDTCHAITGTAFVYQDNLCNDPIITKHTFLNKGNLSLPYDIYFYLYNPNNELIDQGSSSYSMDIGYETEWTISWSQDASWMPGTYRAEAEINGTCSNEENTTAVNSVNPVMPSSCGSTTCNGIIQVTVKDPSSNPIINAQVFFDSSPYSNTDSQGQTSINVSDSGCNQTHQVSIFCSNGAYCETKSTTINYNGDVDPLNFICSVCPQTGNLSATINANNSFEVNDLIELEIIVKDESNNLIDNATLSIYDPFKDKTINDSTINGVFNYSTTAFIAGTYTFNVSASKTGFNSDSTEKTVLVNQPLAIVIVNVSNQTDSGIKKLKGAFVLLDYENKGTTNTEGKLNLSTTQGTHLIEVQCPNTDFCDDLTINSNGFNEAYFLCTCFVDSDGDYFTDEEEISMHTDPYDSSDNYCTRLPELGNELKQIASIQFWQNILSQLTSNKTSDGNFSSESWWSVPAAGLGTLSGFILGIAGGIADDAEFVSDILTLIGTTIKAAFDIKNIINAIGLVSNWQIQPFVNECLLAKQGSIVASELNKVYYNEVLPDLYKNANDINPGNYPELNWDSEDKSNFDKYFVFGYHIGYVSEQAVLLEVAAAKAGKLLKAGTKLEGLSKLGTKLIGRIGADSRFGETIAGIISRTRINNKSLAEVMKSFSNEAVDGIAFTAKHSADSETLLKEIGEQYGAQKINQIGNNINSISNELGENSINKMLKTGDKTFQKNMLGTWNYEGQWSLTKATKLTDTTQVNRAIEKYFQVGISEGEQELLKKSMQNSGALKQINGVDNLTKNVIQSPSYGFYYETKINKKLLDEGYNLNKISFKEGSEFDSLFTTPANKSVIAEIKSGNPSTWYSYETEELFPKFEEQLSGYVTYAQNNNIEEVWLISKQTVPQEIKNAIEALNPKIKVKLESEI